MSKKVRQPGISTTGEKIRFAMGDVGYNIIWGFVGSYLTYYYTDNILVSASVVGTIMLLARFLDGISDILMGVIIEKTSSKWGKARPWLLWMILPLILTFLMVFYVPSFLGDTAKIIYIAVTYILLSAVTYTASNMAYITLFTMFAPDYNDRNVAAVFRTLFAMVTSLAIGMISMPLLGNLGGASSQKAWTTLALIYSGVAFVCVMITFLGVSEKQLTAEAVKAKQKEEKIPFKDVLKDLAKSKYFYLTALLSIAYYLSNSTGGVNIYFARDILGDANLVGMIGLVSLPTLILGAVLAPPLYKKYGKRNVMMFGAFIALVSTVIQLLNPYNKAMFFAFYAIKGFGGTLAGAIATLPGDMADWSEWKIGVRAEGISTSVVSFGSKVGSGVGAGLVGWILAMGHYDGTAAVQTQSALNAEIILMIGVPLALAVLQIILLLFWDMDKKRPQIMKELEVKRKQGE